MEKIDKIDTAQNNVFKNLLKSRKWDKLLNYVKNDNKTIIKNSNQIKNSIRLREDDNTLFSFEEESQKIIFTPKLRFILLLIRIIDFNKITILDRLFNQIMHKIKELDKPQIKRFIESFPKSRFFPITEENLKNHNFLHSLIDVHPILMYEYLPKLAVQKEWYLIHRLYDIDNSLIEKFPDLFLDFLKKRPLNFAQIHNFTKNFNPKLIKEVKKIIEIKKEGFFKLLFPFSKLSLINLEKKCYGWFDQAFFIMTNEEITEILIKTLDIKHEHGYLNNFYYASIIHDILLSIVWNGKGHLLIPHFDKILKSNHKQPISDFLRNNPEAIKNFKDIPDLIVKLRNFSDIFLSPKFLNLIDYDIAVFSAFLNSGCRFWYILKFFKENFRENWDEYDTEILKLYQNLNFSLKTDYETHLSFFLYSPPYYTNKQYFPLIPEDLLNSKVKEYLKLLSTHQRTFLNYLESQLIYDRFNEFSTTIQKGIIDSFSNSSQELTFFIHLVKTTQISSQIVRKILENLNFTDINYFGANNQIFIIIKLFLMEHSLTKKHRKNISKILKKSPNNPLKAQIYSYLGEYETAVEIWKIILPRNTNRKWFISQKLSYLGDLMNLERVFSLNKKNYYHSVLQSIDSEFHRITGLNSQESSNFRFKLRFLEIKSGLYYILNELSSGRKIPDNSCLNELLVSIKILKNRKMPEAEMSYLLFLNEFLIVLENSQKMDTDKILPFIKENVQTMVIPNEIDLRYNQFLNQIDKFKDIHQLSSFKFSNLVNFCPIISTIKEIIFYQKKINSSGAEEKLILWKFSDIESQFILNISENFKTIHVSVIMEKLTFEKPIIDYPNHPLIEIKPHKNNAIEFNSERNSTTEFDYKFYIQGDKFQDLEAINLNFKESNLCGLTVNCRILLKHESSEFNHHSFLISTLENIFPELLNKKKDLRKEEDPITSILELGIKIHLGYFGIQIKLQNPGGESYSGKKTGERDMIFTWKNQEFAILEALRLVSRKNNNYISVHLEKIFKYDNIGHETLIIASYINENLNLDEEWKNYCDLVNKFHWKYSKEGNLKDKSQELPHDIKKGLTFHKRNTEEEPNVTIYHYLIHGIFD